MADVSINSIFYAVLGGAVPTFLWLWFWLSKDDHPEPGMVLTLAFIGGALSVDKEWRTKDFDWWEDEELNIVELNEMINKYEAAKPRIMVTHEVPDAIATTMQAMSGRQKLDWPSRTRQAFDTMFQLHKPEIWIYGHWHYSFDHVILGTRFKCLAELETFDMEV